MHILYLVHDLCDPAVRRRVAMLRAGRAEVTLAGFCRADVTAEIAAIAPIELGRTADGRFAQRLVAVARAAATLGFLLRGVRRPDVIIGRNLEMLALARRAAALFQADIPVVYECLDIHRLLLGDSRVARALRAAERRLGRDVALLLTSSPAFLREYFRRFGQIDAPALLLHNKVLELIGQSRSNMPPPPRFAWSPSPVPSTSSGGRGSAARPAATLDPPPRSGGGGPPKAVEGASADSSDSRAPWTIGWFGALRCRKSLALLAAFTRRMEGRFEVVLRGRPACREFPDFDAFVAAEPFMRFEGSYRNPEDLAAIYGAVHFSWAIDFFEEGLNSSWLLPNRLYEGSLHGAVPIAMRGTETARFLADRKLGLLLDAPKPEALVSLLGGIVPEDHAALRGQVLAEDRATWVCDERDCRALVDRLRALDPAATAAPVLRAA